MPQNFPPILTQPQYGEKCNHLTIGFRIFQISEFLRKTQNKQMNHSRQKIANGSIQTAQSQTVPNSSLGAIIDVETIQSSQPQNESTEEEIEKKAIQTIYAQLKQVNSSLLLEIAGKIDVSDSFSYCVVRWHVAETQCESEHNGRRLKDSFDYCSSDRRKK